MVMLFVGLIVVPGLALLYYAFTGRMSSLGRRSKAILWILFIAGVLGLLGLFINQQMYDPVPR